MNELEILRAENHRLLRALVALRNSDNAAVAMLQHHTPYTEIAAHIEAGVAAAEQTVTGAVGEAS